MGPQYATLVYQAGIANVFDTGKDTPTRLLQSDFRSCENFCYGLEAAGVTVHVAWCNQAGDILNAVWHLSDFDNAPFSESFRYPRNWES